MAKLRKGGTSWSHYRCVSRQVHSRQALTPLCAGGYQFGDQKTRPPILSAPQPVINNDSGAMNAPYPSNMDLTCGFPGNWARDGYLQALIRPRLPDAVVECRSLTARGTYRRLVNTMIRSIYDN